MRANPLAFMRGRWALVVMGQFTRGIIGFGVHAGDVDGRTLCRLFNQTIDSFGEADQLG